MYTPRRRGVEVADWGLTRPLAVPEELDPDGGVVLVVDPLERRRVRVRPLGPEGRRWPKGWRSQYIWV